MIFTNLKGNPKCKSLFITLQAMQVKSQIFPMDLTSQKIETIVCYYQNLSD